MMRIGDAFPSNYLKASDLQGKIVTVTIREVKNEQVGRDKEWKPVLYLEGKEKGIVLNRVNAKAIVQLAGSDDTDMWPGVRIALFQAMVEFGGEQVEAIRVKAPLRAAPLVKKQPEPEPEFVAEDEDDERDSIPF